MNWTESRFSVLGGNSLLLWQPLLFFNNLIWRLPEFKPNQMSGRRRQWQPTPVLLPGKSYGRRSLLGYSPWDCKELDTTERLHFHFSLSCTGEGNGKPLQYSCLENPRDREAWWAAIYGVAQNLPRLKQISSSSRCQMELSCEMCVHCTMPSSFAAVSAVRST